MLRRIRLLDAVELELDVTLDLTGGAPFLDDLDSLSAHLTLMTSGH
ncbi:hypothetical protein [Nonomuraea endophytica]